MEELSPHPQLPPGFRFHPTDEELLLHYLKNKISSIPLPVSIITDVDLYKFDPWDLPGLARFGEQEWYFFSPRERKYPNGDRPNRAAASGYWKATGIDKPVVISGSSHKVGVKKGLVFYKGRPPKGIKTSWIMHEYRLTDPIRAGAAAAAAPGRKGSMRLDDWVLCRIYKRGSSHVARKEAGKGEEEEDIKPLQELPRQEAGDEEYKFLHRFLREDDTSDDSEALGADDLAAQLVSTKLKRKMSLVFDNDIDDLYPSQTRHKNNSTSVFQSFNPGYEDPTPSDFHLIYSLPIIENPFWSSETGTAYYL